MNPDFKLGLQIGLDVKSVSKLAFALASSKLQTPFVDGMRAALNVRIGL